MNVTEITQLARDIRVATLKSLNHLGFGHYGGSMSVVETLAVLYGAVMKIDPADPDWPERDYFDAVERPSRARVCTVPRRLKAISRAKS